MVWIVGHGGERHFKHQAKLRKKKRKSKEAESPDPKSNGDLLHSIANIAVNDDRSAAVELSFGRPSRLSLEGAHHVLPSG